MPLNTFLQRAFCKLKTLLTKPPEDPADPYALVGAPVKPKLPGLSAKATAVPERYDFN